MISSVFGKTKPINYIIILGFLFLFYWLVHLVLYARTYGLEEFLLQLLVLGVLLFGVFIVDFIVKRNQITGTHAFVILYFTLLIVIFPKVLLDNNALLCSFFLLLATRRLISLKSLKDVKLKILDATLWTLVASCFYDWALLYLILVYVTIYFYEPKNIRNWLVPLAGVIAVFVILYTLLILTGIPGFLKQHYKFSLPEGAGFFTDWTNSIKVIAYAGVAFITGFLAFLKLGKLGLGRIITMRLIATSLILGLGVTFLKSDTEVHPVILTFFPGAVLLVKYLEVIKKGNTRELVLIGSVLLPFLILLTESVLK